MSSKYQKVAREQYCQIVNQAAGFGQISLPKEGWIRTVRSALAMTGVTLSKRLGGHKTTAAYLERAELSGSISLKKMQQAAEAMNCHFVYAIVPKIAPHKELAPIEAIIDRQAEPVARSIVEEAYVQMSLEDQWLSKEEIEKEILRLKKQIIEDMPKDFWDD